MRIIYVHGLDSSANAMKGQMVEAYCKTHYPDIKVLRPDLNMTPGEVYQKLHDLATETSKDDSSATSLEQTVLIGSSLGGYFSTLVSNATGYPAVLLNPSTQPHISLQRFLGEDYQGQQADIGDTDTVDDLEVIYQTAGGWGITRRDLNWFHAHILDNVVYPKRMFAIIKSGDELLDPKIATAFYQGQDVEVDLQAGGDHRMTDFAEQLPMLMQHLAPYM